MSVSSIEAIGYTAFGFNVVANLMLAHMNLWGWLIRIFSNVLWVTYAVQVPSGGPMWLNHLTFLMINIYGFNEWKTIRSKEC